MKNELVKDFGYYPKDLRDLFFELYDWLDAYGFKKQKSKLIVQKDR